jgi:hypothetical protein
MHKRSIAGPGPFDGNIGKMHLWGVYSVGEAGG